jgi:hypothetical protein
MKYIKHKLISSWFPRAAWEPSADAPASCTVTLARHKLHSHAARGNEKT